MNWIMRGEKTTAATWVVDAAHSTARFEVSNMWHTAHGNVPVRAGTLTLGPDGQPAAVAGTVDLAAIDTGNPRRDRDLRKPSLLDLDRHPEMTFAAAEITGTDGEWRVAGTATLRGRTAPLVFTVTGFTLAADSATITAEAVLDRRLIGVRAPQFMIGRWISIAVQVVVRQAG